MKNKILRWTLFMLAAMVILLIILLSCASINPRHEEITLKFYKIEKLPQIDELLAGEILAGAAKVKITPTFEKGQ